MSKNISDDAYAAIDGEITYAMSLGPDRVEAQERPHTTGEYLTMLRAYMQDADQAWTKHGGDDEALEVVRKIAAIAIRCMDDCGVRYR